MVLDPTADLVALLEAGTDPEVDQVADLVDPVVDLVDLVVAPEAAAAALEAVAGSSRWWRGQRWRAWTRTNNKHSFVLTVIIKNLHTANLKEVFTCGRI